MNRLDLKYPIPSHPTFNINDSTKLKTFMRCPRKYFYQYVLGWSLDTPNIHLVFGEAWHLAMAHLITHKYSPQTVLEAHELFRAKYLEHFREADEEANAPKNLENSMSALILYAQTYNTDLYEVVRDKDGNPWTEIAGTVPVSKDQVVHFKTDAVMRDPELNQVFVMEHKTSTYIGPGWQDQWTLSIQIGTYLHALCCVFPPDEVWGLRINGTIFRKPPQLKKDGTPYANSSRGNEVIRVPIRKTNSMMEQWLENTLWWLRQVDANFETLSACDTDSNTIMHSFPLNTESCVNFGRVCQYHDFCCCWTNPLQRCQQPPIGFIEKRWDPTESEPGVTKIFRL